MQDPLVHSLRVLFFCRSDGAMRWFPRMIWGAFGAVAAFLYFLWCSDKVDGPVEKWGECENKSVLLLFSLLFSCSPLTLLHLVNPPKKHRHHHHPPTSPVPSTHSPPHHPRLRPSPPLPSLCPPLPSPPPSPRGLCSTPSTRPRSPIPPFGWPLIPHPPGSDFSGILSGPLPKGSRLCSSDGIRGQCGRRSWV